ncbi:MAG: hypothetical protein JOY70_04335 [Acidisphaera sp.]|nr:hypothetical protein [Acidisphaera sp.]
MDRPHFDDLSRDQMIHNRLALLESRVQALAVRLSVGLDRSGEEGDAGGVPTFVEIDAESPELAQGFYAREWDAHGNPFRWAGCADYFEFRFFLDRRSARPFRMRGILAAGCNPSALRVYADCRPIPAKLKNEGAMTEIAGRIPADPLGTGVALSFFCTPAPQTGADLRRLSFAFSTLVVGEATPTLAKPDQPTVNPLPYRAG